MNILLFLLFKSDSLKQLHTIIIEPIYALTSPAASTQYHISLHYYRVHLRRKTKNQQSSRAVIYLHIKLLVMRGVVYYIRIYVILVPYYMLEFSKKVKLMKHFFKINTVSAIIFCYFQKQNFYRRSLSNTLFLQSITYSLMSVKIV